jgi:hypothetical protein
VTVSEARIQIDRITTAADLAKLETAWALLFDREPGTHVAASYAWIYSNAAFRCKNDDWSVYVAPRGGELVGGLFGFRSAFSVACAPLSIFEVSTENGCGVLVDSRYGSEVLWALIDAVREDYADCAFVQFKYLPAGLFRGMYASFRDRALFTSWTPEGYGSKLRYDPGVRTFCVEDRKQTSP